MRLRTITPSCSSIIFTSYHFPHAVSNNRIFCELPTVILRENNRIFHEIENMFESWTFSDPLEDMCVSKFAMQDASGSIAVAMELYRLLSDDVKKS